MKEPATDEQPSAEAMKLASRHADGEVKKCAAEIDALIAQRVCAETERWQNRDCQRLEQIDQLQAALQSFQIARDERPAPEPTCEGGVPLGTMGATCPKCGATENDICGYVGAPAERPAPAPSASASTGEQPASPTAVVDYTNRAREIWDEAYDNANHIVSYGKTTKSFETTLGEIAVSMFAAALSAVASERDATAIRAFGQRVWSDTEEVAYQAGVSDTRERLQEPYMREAVKAAMRERDFARDGEYLPDDCYEAFADAALTKIAEMLK